MNAETVKRSSLLRRYKNTKTKSEKENKPYTGMELLVDSVRQAYQEKRGSSVELYWRVLL